MNFLQTQWSSNTLLHRITQAILPSTVFLGLLALPTPAEAISLVKQGTFSTGIFDDGAALHSAYDPLTQTLFVANGSTNQIDALNISNPENPLLSFNIDLNPFGSVTNVAYGQGLFGVSFENDTVTDPGSVVFFDPFGDLVEQVSVGALPDSLIFTPDGSKVLVANEGEPSDDYTIDPLGTVSIIDIATWDVLTADFQAFNNSVLGESVRIFGPNATVAQDLEPEDIAISEDGKTAFVTLQENNAVGVLNLETNQFEQVLGLGFKDFSLPENMLDASDRDDGINIQNWPVFGIYQPDELQAYSFGDETFFVTANEGDSRQYEFEDENGEEIAALDEETSVGDVVLDPDAFPNASALQQDENLGRLEITNTLGDTDGDGDFDQLFAFGGRSFSIFNSSGELIFDSGDDFEQITAELFPEFFNATNDENNFDNRSDNKGIEPEGIALGTIEDQTYAFIGLERIGGQMVYNITDPNNPFFVTYKNNRNFSVELTLDEEGDPDPTAAELTAIGDLGPEGLTFIPAEESPTGEALLVVANEVSGTTTLYAARVPEPGTILGLMAVGMLGGVRLKRKS
ncbi:MAG: choice-of-anchor I family protein [Microcoleaceae cyanobacterium]